MEEKKAVQRRKKVLQGIVVSDKMDKTAVVKVERTIQHPLYKRTLKRTKKYKVHDENNVCGIGDRIRLIECKPLSKDKCWRLLEVTTKAL
ncbi:MAG: 30S ribosomal protein S17 [SAR324 cluster bacterium]|uniref:Small ribosomal subunit protein uS17 n=1 Tax=SAR324 cluster bacterium TaxID=2024889 RepID=A0A2A4TA91_9DELT|nr:MAG: 30S ribosomal protein S17 [SAR324 cluster bacterium]